MGIARETFRHTAVYSLANVIGRASSLILLPFYAHLFDTEGYGVMGMVDASVGIIGIAFGAAANNAFLRVYHAQPPERKSLVVGTAIRVTWLFVVSLVALPLAFSGPVSQWLLGSDRYQAIVVLALLALAVDVPGVVASTTLVIRQDSVLYSTINVVRLVASLVGNIALVFGLGLGLLGVFVTSLVVAAFTSATFHYLAVREHGFAVDANVRRDIVRIWLPLVPGDMFAYFGRQAERFVVRAQLGIGALGILEMAYKFAPILNLFVMLPFMRAWQTKSMEIADRTDAPRVMADVFVKFAFAMLALAVFLAGCIRDVIVLLTPPGFWSAVPLARIEIATTVVAGGSAFMTFGLLYAHKSSKISQIKIAVSVMKVVLSVTLIASFGLAGAATAGLIAESVTFAWLVRCGQREYHVPVDWRRVAGLCGLAAACVAFAVTISGPATTLNALVVHALVAPFVELARNVVPAGMFEGRQPALAGLAISAAACSTFLLCAPIAHADWWQRLRRGARDRFLPTR